MSGHTETAPELSVIDSKLWAAAVKSQLNGRPIWIFFADHHESMDHARAVLQAYLVELRRKDDSDQRIIAELRAALKEAHGEIKKLTPYRNELIKLAAEHGEPNDPFALWEILASKVAS